jgi:enoyl-CoA hydratase
MEAVNKGMEMTLSEGLYLEAVLFGVACATEDKKEGTTAFLEKRAAQFKGKYFFAADFHGSARIKTD